MSDEIKITGKAYDSISKVEDRRDPDLGLDYLHDTLVKKPTIDDPWKIK